VVVHYIVQITDGAASDQNHTYCKKRFSQFDKLVEELKADRWWVRECGDIALGDKLTVGKLDQRQLERRMGTLGDFLYRVLRRQMGLSEGSQALLRDFLQSDGTEHTPPPVITRLKEVPSAAAGAEAKEVHMRVMAVVQVRAVRKSR
jgi:hypothetical protein